MEDKMAAGAFGRDRNYGWGDPWKRPVNVPFRENFWDSFTRSYTPATEVWRERSLSLLIFIRSALIWSLSYTLHVILFI